MTALEIKGIKYDLIKSIIETDDIVLLKKLLDYFNNIKENDIVEPLNK